MSINITTPGVNKSYLDLTYLRLDTTNDPLTGDLNLGDNYLQNVECIDFNLTPTVTGQEGRLFWNSDDGTLNLGMPGGNVNLQIGQEQIIRVKATEDIVNGQMVYISGASSNNPEVSLTNASSTTGSKTIAMATESFNSGQHGYVTTFGQVRELALPTATYLDGDTLYLGIVNGSITNEKLNHPNFRIKIGYVLRAHNTEGVALISISGDQWLKRFQAMSEPTGFDLNHSDLIGDISFSDSLPDRTFTIEPKGGQDYFNFFVGGREFRKSSAEIIQITDVEGIHVIYYNTDGVLSEIANPSTAQVAEGIRTVVFVAILYWNATDNEAIYVGEERHGIQMDGSTHSYLHFAEGLKYLSGLGLNTMSVDGSGVTADAQFGIDLGGVSDEDIHISVSAVTSTTGLPIYYMLGASPRWVRDVNAGFSVRTFDGTTSTRLAYNQYTGGAWQLTEESNGDFVLYHVFATTEKDNPMICIMGQNGYSTKRAARAGALTEIHSLVLDDILFPEIRPIATIIFQTKLAYANNVNAMVVSTDEGDDYIDWRSEIISRTEISTDDHGSLTGLESDDHIQYVLVNGARALAGAWDMGNFALTNVNIDTGNIHNDVVNIEWDLAYDHISESGASHSYIDQSVVSGSTPTFIGTNFSGIPATAIPSALLIDGTRALTADWDAGSHKITAEQLESDIATGTAPLLVASTTLITNLNADTVDGIHSSSTATANKLLSLDASKDLVLGTGDVEATDGKFSNRLGIGTSSPSARLHAVEEGTWNATLWDAYGTGYSPQFALRQAGGTIASPTATVNGDTLGSFSFRGHTGAAFSGTRGILAVAAAENWNATDNGTYAFISTTKKGTTMPVSRLKVYDSGIIDTAYQSSCYVYLNSAQSIGGSTFTTVNLDTETQDIQNEFNTTTHLFTATVAGDYLVVGQIGFLNVPDRATVVIQLMLNSTGITLSRFGGSTNSTSDMEPNSQVITPMSIGDTISMKAWQSSGGGSLSLRASKSRTFLCVTKLN